MWLIYRIDIMIQALHFYIFHIVRMLKIATIDATLMTDDKDSTVIKNGILSCDNKREKIEPRN